MKPKRTDQQKPEEERSDAWERFERAVDAAVKGGPKHRPPKPPAANKKAQKAKR